MRPNHPSPADGEATPARPRPDSLSNHAEDPGRPAGPLAALTARFRRLRTAEGVGRKPRRSPSPETPAAGPSPEQSRRYRWRVVVVVVGVAFAVAAGSFLAVFATGDNGATRTREVPLTEAMQLIRDDKVAAAKLDDGDRRAVLTLDNGDRAVTGYPQFGGVELFKSLSDAHVKVDVSPVERGGFGDLAMNMLPLLLLMGVLLFVVRRFAPGGAGLMTNKSTGPVETPTTRFADVAGATETVADLREIVDYLEDPSSFHALGARAPHGVLLVGPPGTGKTLLARATAGEAGVPFFALSGSDFVEMFVGVGAARVRKVFAEARRAGRSIVFIDEIDAIGKARSGRGTTGDSEREGTLNQLLVEMDGFADSGVVVMAATNRDDTLDAALLRPGRFDRRVMVGAPDRKGRQELFALYLAKAPLDADADAGELALGMSRRSPGMTGADIDSVVNEAALLARRAGRSGIAGVDLDDAIELVVMGRERRSAEVTDLSRRITAWHEAGHALCALMHPSGMDPVRVSIIPRGGAGGVTWHGVSDESFITRTEALGRLVGLFGGRAGEEVLLDGEFTQGASSDVAAATGLARQMVCEWAMTDFGISHVDTTHLLGEEATAVRAAVEGLLADALAGARALLVEHRGLLEAIAEALLAEDTLDAADLARLRTAHTGVAA
jgi:cell division protease FtsH